MKNANRINILIALFIGITIALGCSSSGAGTQQAEANKIVDEANKKLDATKEKYAAVEVRYNFLFSANIQTVQQLRYYKAKMDGEAKSIASEYDSIATSLKDISKQYDDISRLNVDEKYKEYAKIKSDEYAKRSEAVAIRKGNAQAFAEIDDPRIMVTKFAENNSKSDKLFKDAEDFGTKAKSIEENNKEIFRQA